MGKEAKGKDKDIHSEIEAINASLNAHIAGGSGGDVKDEKIAELTEKVAFFEDAAKRSMADYINFKRQADLNIANAKNYGIAIAVAEIMPTLDAFEKATEAFRGENFKGDEKDIEQGFNMIYEGLKKALTKLGVEELPGKAGDNFDPNLHNAVMSEEVKGFKPNQIVEVFLKGYKLGDKVIRHSMVKVCK
jgi:molecular chaperone GrpE